MLDLPLVIKDIELNRTQGRERLGELVPRARSSREGRALRRREGGWKVTDTTEASFRIIGENVHTTRIVRRPGPLVGVDEHGREAIRFADEHGVERWLSIPSEEQRTQEYEEGRVKHVRSAVRLAKEGDGADAEAGLAYLRAMALRQVECGAHYLDVNVDEYSHRLPEQIETMRWLVEILAPVVPVPLSIDSSNLEIITAGMVAADRSAGPPMLNSASLERVEALDVAADAGGAVIVTAAGASGMPTNTAERVENAGTMIDLALGKGIDPDRIYVDPLVFPISVDGEFGEHCLGAFRELRGPLWQRDSPHGRHEQRELRAARPPADQRRVPRPRDRGRRRQWDHRPRREQRRAGTCPRSRVSDASSWPTTC